MAEAMPMISADLQDVDDKEGDKMDVKRLRTRLVSIPRLPLSKPYETFGSALPKALARLIRHIVVRQGREQELSDAT